MPITKKRKIEVNNNARIDSFYKPVPKDSLRKRLVSNDENASQDTNPSPTSSQNSNKKVFGDSSNKITFGDNSNKTFGEQKVFLKAKVFGEQNQSVSKSVRQPLKEKITKSSPSTFKIDKTNRPTKEPAFEVLRDPGVETSQKDNSGLNTQFIAESDTLCTQYTDVTSSPLDLFGENNVCDNEDIQDSPLIIYKDQDSNHSSPLIIYKDHDSPLNVYNDENDNQDSPLLIYKDEDDIQDSPPAIYKDEDDNQDTPLEVYKDENDDQDSPLIVYKDEDDNQDSPLIVYKDEDDNQDSPLVIYKDEDENDHIQKAACENTNHRTPLAVKYTNENDSGLLFNNQQEEEEDDPPLIIFRDEPLTVFKDESTNEDVHKSEEFVFDENNYDQHGTTIDSSKDFFDDDDDDQNDYADIVDSLNTNDFSVTATFSQESIESTPPVVKSPLIRPISVLGSKTFFSKYGSKK